MLTSAFANKVSIPETCWTVYKKCVLHQSHKVIQDKKGKDSLPGKAALDGKQRGLHGQTKPILPPKVKPAREMVLRLETFEPSCRSQRMLPMKRCGCLELGGDK